MPESRCASTSFLQYISKGSDHKKEVQDIKYLAYASPELYRSVFFKYWPEINIRKYYNGDPALAGGLKYMLLGVKLTRKE
jgi:hypothetical protein